MSEGMSAKPQLCWHLWRERHWYQYGRLTSGGIAFHCARCCRSEPWRCRNEGWRVASRLEET